MENPGGRRILVTTGRPTGWATARPFPFKNIAPEKCPRSAIIRNRKLPQKIFRQAYSQDSIPFPFPSRLPVLPKKEAPTWAPRHDQT